MKPSPGPWRRGIGNDCHTVFDLQGSVVADRVGTIDGHLVAAAPDMLAALKWYSMGDLGKCARDAIAKAEGGPHKPDKGTEP